MVGETHCNHLHCWIWQTCHWRTGSTLTVYWRSWRVSLLGGRRKCLLMPGLAVSPWRRHQFLDTCCCWSWIPQRKWPAALIRRRCHVEKMASVRRYCTGRRRRFVWLQQAERWWRGWKCQWNRGKQEGENLKFLTSTKVKESDTQLADRSWRTGWRGQVSHLASSCWADPVIDRIGRKDTSFLWVFGRPYMRSRLEPVGRMALYSVFEINFPWSVVATVVVSVFLF